MSRKKRIILFISAGGALVACVVAAVIMYVNSQREAGEGATGDTTQLLEESISQNGNSDEVATSYQQLLFMHESAGRYSDAAKVASDQAKKDGKYSSHENAARYYELAGDTDRAIEHYEEAIRLVQVDEAADTAAVLVGEYTQKIEAIKAGKE